MKPYKWLVDGKQNGRAVHSCLAVCICSEINNIDLWLAFRWDSSTSETLMLLWDSHCFTKQTLEITNLTIALWLKGVRLWFRFQESMPDAEQKLHYRWPTIFDPGPDNSTIPLYLPFAGLAIGWYWHSLHYVFTALSGKQAFNKSVYDAGSTLHQHWVNVSCSSVDDHTAEKQTGRQETSEAFDKLYLLSRLLRPPSAMARITRVVYVDPCLATPMDIYIRPLADFNPNNMTLKWIR